MMTTRTFAVLRTDTMVGTAFILPILFTRVIGRPFPQIEDVYALIRAGGCMIEAQPVEVSIDGDEDPCRAIGDAFADILVHRPLFVDLETGAIFAVRHPLGMLPFVAESGSLFEAFGRPLPQGSTPDSVHTLTITTRIKMLPCAALREGKPDLSLADAKDVAFHGAPVAMTSGQLTRTLLHAVRCSAQKHRRITEGRETDQFGPVLPTDVIASYSFA